MTIQIFYSFVNKIVLSCFCPFLFSESGPGWRQAQRSACLMIPTFHLPSSRRCAIMCDLCGARVKPKA